MELFDQVSLRKKPTRMTSWTATEHPMVDDKSQRLMPGTDCEAAVAEYIRTRGVTRCPTACVLPTQGSVAAADQEALEVHAARRDRLRRERVAARAQRFYDIEIVRPAQK
jgi:hypothetical protein